MAKLRYPNSLGLDRFSGIYLWIVFIVVFGVARPDTFLTIDTLHSVAAQQAIAGIIALALLLPLAAGQFDLAVGATANLTGMIAVLCQVDLNLPVAVSVVIGVAAGLLIGLVNAFVVVRLKVNSFIATLGMGSALAATQVIVTNSEQPLPPSSPVWGEITQRPILGFQMVVLYLIVIGLLVWWFLEHTPAGRYIYACGINSEAACLSGVNVDKWTWVTMSASGLLSGLAGVLFCSLTGPSLQFGPALLLPAFAAAFLGSTQLKPGRFNVWGTLLAIFVLATGVEGLQLVSGAQWLNDMFNGVALVLAVALAGIRRNRRRRGELPAAEIESAGKAGLSEPERPDLAPVGAESGGRQTRERENQ